MIRAVEHFRRMRGGAQSQMILADDGHHYIVKALNNPQHPRVLANEWMASSIAQAIGLSVPPFEVMDISGEFLARSPECKFSKGHRTLAIAPGLAFASRIPTPDTDMPIYDYLPEAGLELVENLDEFAPMLAVDKWLCNCDGRQVIFCRPKPGGKLRVFFIDFGFCFNAGSWDFPDSPLRGVYCRNLVYACVTGFESFEPWLSRIERFTENHLLKIMAAMPLEWHNPKATVRLIEALLARREHVHEQITAVRKAFPARFENWSEPVRNNGPVATQTDLFSQPV